ncbi:hypothetical protein [Geoglobus acetivorans]|uniref:Uncharacterized protein n=1 Tax=Geoglobus acetivorans TaxID=565033 RepID=A0A0A7GJG8_GEOAI|nr:hypothetical protein GACE_2042 [Geoglobus acetivorans]
MDEYARVCPRCLSSDVEPDLYNPAAVAFGALNTYRCNSCGHTGVFFPEFRKEDLKTAEKLQIEEKGAFEGTSFAKGFYSAVALFSALGLVLSVLFYLMYHDPVFMLAFSVYLVILTSNFRMERRESLLYKICLIISLVLYSVFFRLL